jgi:hypothetical protein
MKSVNARRAGDRRAPSIALSRQYRQNGPLSACPCCQHATSLLGSRHVGRDSDWLAPSNQAMSESCRISSRSPWTDGRGSPYAWLPQQIVGALPFSVSAMSSLLYGGPPLRAFSRSRYCPYQAPCRIITGVLCLKFTLILSMHAATPRLNTAQVTWIRYSYHVFSIFFSHQY